MENLRKGCPFLAVGGGGGGGRVDLFLEQPNFVQCAALNETPGK